ncbi:MAG: TerD family protein [Oscillospiraceae bacterium]
MQFQVPIRVKKAVDRNSLLENYGAVNTQPTLIVSRQNGMQQESPTPQRYSQPYAPPPQSQRQTFNPPPVPRQVPTSAPPRQPQRQPVNPSAVPRQVPTSAPPPQSQRQPVTPSAMLRQPRKPLQGTILRRGQKFALSGANGAVSFVRIGLDWVLKNPNCDLDASAFLLGGNDKVLGDDWFIFYGQPQSPDGSVRYFDKNSAKPDEKTALEIRLSQVHPQVQKIVVAVTIYEAIQNHYHFGMTESVTATIFDMNARKPLASLDLTDNSPVVTALVVGEFYRYQGSWKFNAVGSGVGKDLAGFCAMYGVVLE